MSKKTIEDVQVNGKKVLVRCDFNVPLDATATSPTISASSRLCLPSSTCWTTARLSSSAPTWAVPKGEFNMKYSLAPVAARLSELLGKEVPLAADVIGERRQEQWPPRSKPGDVMLIENVRFHKEEEKNDPAFAKELASMAEMYVNDAFGTAHRAHASTAGVADLPAPLSCRLPDPEGNQRHGQGSGRTRHARSWPSWAARRFPTRSASSTTCSTRLTR